MCMRKGFKQVALLGVAFLLSSGLALTYAAEAKAVKLELWTFVDTHARWFRSMAEDYEKVNPGFKLKVTEIAYDEMHDKLLISLQTGIGAPDMADVEQGRFGGFILGKIGFVDLTEKLKAGGYLEQLVASREALYSWKGKIYGVEHALCPVVLYYRTDVFEDAGITVPLETWDDFITAGQKLSKGKVKMIALGPDLWPILLRQRGLDLFDENADLTADSPKAIETLAWLFDLRNKHGIAEDPPGGTVYNPAWYGALKEGAYLTHMGADWYAGFLEDNVAELSGKWGAMPLPYWKDDPYKTRTSCLGGTGNTITKFSKNQDEAWEFMKFSMLSVEGNVRRYLLTKLWPPLKPSWEDERLYKPSPYFGDQVLGQLFAEVGPEVPAQHQSPYLPMFHSGAEPWITKYWRDIIDGRKTPEQAAKEYSKIVREKMQS